MSETYRIVRYRFKGDKSIIETGLSLDEAQEHCNNPETSSSTATEPDDSETGPWFDAYERED